MMMMVMIIYIYIYIYIFIFIYGSLVDFHATKVLIFVEIESQVALVFLLLLTNPHIVLGAFIYSLFL